MAGEYLFYRGKHDKRLKDNYLGISRCKRLIRLLRGQKIKFAVTYFAGKLVYAKITF